MKEKEFYCVTEAESHKPHFVVTMSLNQIPMGRNNFRNICSNKYLLSKASWWADKREKLNVVSTYISDDPFVCIMVYMR